MINDEIIQKFREKFLEEANILLDEFEKGLLELEADPTDKELNESVFRLMHTLKGISAMYGFDYISEYTHLLENIFQNMRDGLIQLSSEISEVSLLSIDHIRSLLSDEKLQNTNLKEAHSQLTERIELIAKNPQKSKPDIQSEEKPTSDHIKSWYIIINTNEQMFFRRVNLVNICEDLMKLGELKIQRIPVLNAENSDSWGLMFISTASLDDILDVLMFIEDDCSVIKVTDYDIFKSVPGDENQSLPNPKLLKSEPSILDLIEKNDLTVNTKIGQPVNHPKDSEKQHSIHRQSKSILVDTQKLDNLMYLVSELITLNSQIGEATKNRDFEKQQDYVEKLESLSKQFRSNAIEIRLVPLFSW